MPQGKGTYGSKVGRPPKDKKKSAKMNYGGMAKKTTPKMMGGGMAKKMKPKMAHGGMAKKKAAKKTQRVLNTTISKTFIKMV